MRQILRCDIHAAFAERYAVYTLLPMMLAVVAMAITGSYARGQSNTTRPSQPATPFGTDWAKPHPGTNGYIYDDPRLKNQQSLPPDGRKAPCPAGRMYDPVNQICR